MNNTKNNSNGQSPGTTWTWFPLPMAFYNRLAEIGRAACAYIVLARHANRDGECWPSQETIAEAIGVSMRSVREYLAILENTGLIQRRQRRRKTDVFTLPDLIKPGSVLPGLNSNPASCFRQARQPASVKPGSVLPRKNNHLTKPPNKAADAALPEVLDTEKFRDAWTAFQQHRREAKKTMTPTAESRAIIKLERMGHDRAVAALDHSMANGYTGVYEPSSNGNGKPSQPKQEIEYRD